MPRERSLVTRIGIAMPLLQRDRASKLPEASRLQAGAGRAPDRAILPIERQLVLGYARSRPPTPRLIRSRSSGGTEEAGPRRLASARSPVLIVRTQPGLAVGRAQRLRRNGIAIGHRRRPRHMRHRSRPAAPGASPRRSRPAGSKRGGVVTAQHARRVCVRPDHRDALARPASGSTPSFFSSTRLFSAVFSASASCCGRREIDGSAAPDRQRGPAGRRCDSAPRTGGPARDRCLPCRSVRARRLPCNDCRARRTSAERRRIAFVVDARLERDGRCSGRVRRVLVIAR